jgi:Uma2 family endonuclease
MSRITRPPVVDNLNYPTRDGKPMAETDVHLLLMLTLIPTLRDFFLPRPRVYVGGNMLVFYERGNKRKHVSPDVFVVPGVPNHLHHLRDNFLIWEEGKAPQVVIELTSKTTRREDTRTKFALYRDVLKVREYFLFDPRAEYLKPSMQGYRLRGEDYVPIKPVDGRLPSRVLGLHLERDGQYLRLWNPATGRWLLSPEEAREQAEAEAERQAEARRQAEAEVERLRREIEELRRRES